MLNIGTLARFTPATLAERAADKIERARYDRARCIPPRGGVILTVADEAVPADIVGVYAPTAADVTLRTAILDDLTEAIDARGIAPDTSHRRSGT